MQTTNKQTTGPRVTAAADDGDETRRRTIRDLDLAIRQDKEKTGTDIIAFLVIAILFGLFCWGAWELWALILSAPSHAM